MFYTQSQQQTNNTQCCLFGSFSKQITQDGRIVQDGLIGNKMSINSARGHISQKNSIIKNPNSFKKQFSEQKRKINLSKNAQKKHVPTKTIQVKPEPVQILDKYLSVPKHKINEKRLDSNKLTQENLKKQVFFETLAFKSVPPTISSIAQSKKVAPNFVIQAASNNNPPNFSYRTYGATPASRFNAPNFNKIKLVSNLQNSNPYPHSLKIGNQVANSMLPNQYSLIASNHSINNVKKPSQDVRIVDKELPSLSLLLNQNNHNLKALPSTLQTDRIKTDSRNMNYSFLKTQQNQIAESRMTQPLMPQLGRVRTTASVYGGSQYGKKQIQESVILIDFFNPSQNFKKEIQDKIANNSNQNFQLFHQ